MRVRGVVINLHGHGATVRLDDGTLAAVPQREFQEHRAAYVAAYDRREPIALVLAAGRHPTVGFTAPVSVAAAVDALGLRADAFETQMTDFLRSSLERTPERAAGAAERHFIRKKRRAASFEARTPRA